MGCCNKKHDGDPISARRYYAGLAFLGGAQVGTMLLLRGLSVPFPRYRKLLPFAREYMKDTFESALNRERIVIRGQEPVEEEICEWEPGLHAGLDWAPPAAPSDDPDDPGPALFDWSPPDLASAG